MNDDRRRWSDADTTLALNATANDDINLVEKWHHTVTPAPTAPGVGRAAHPQCRREVA